MSEVKRDDTDSDGDSDHGERRARRQQRKLHYNHFHSKTKADGLPTPAGVQVAVNTLLTGSNGSKSNPAISFNGDPSSGWYLDDDGSIVFTAWGDDNIIQNPEYTEFRKSLILDDIPCETSIDDECGALYKKEKSTGLWWKTTAGEINLATGGLPDPLLLSQGNSTAPSYSFATDSDTGLYLQNIGSLSLTAAGVEALRITSGFVKAYKPIEILDAGLLESPNTDLSGYLYKRPGEAGLWWKTSTTDLDLTAKFPSIFNMANGSATAPMYSFTNNTNTGMYLVSNGNLGITVNGALKAEFKQSEITTSVPIKGGNGTSLQPTFTFSTSANTGMFQSVLGRLSFTTNGVHVVDMDSSSLKSIVPITIPDGTQTSPAIRFTSETNTGFHKNTTGVISLDVLGNEIIQFNSTGIDLKTGVYKANNGTASSPVYTFSANTSTGLFYDMSGYLGVTVSGTKIINVKNNYIEPLKQIRSIDSVIGAPQYSFASSPASGLCYDSVNNSVSLNLAGTSNLVSVDSSKIKLIGPVEIGESTTNSSESDLTGRLYKKPNSNGLWWNVNGNEVDLSSTGIVSLPPTLNTSNGSLDIPSYAFGADADTGFYHVNDGVIGVSSNSKLAMSISSDLVNLHNTPIELNGGRLYKKDNSNGLWWNVNGTEVDVSSIPITYPIQATSNGTAMAPTYSFSSDTSTGMYKNSAQSIGFTTSGSLKMYIDTQKITCDLPVEIKESATSNPYTNTHGRLYKEQGTGHLIWNTSDLGPINVTKDLTRYLAVSSNNALTPDFSFTTDDDTGMYLATNDVLGLVAAGSLGLAVSQLQTILYNTLVVKDTTASTPAILGEGHLYKKPGRTGLFWNTVSGSEVDLTQVRFPLVSSSDGNALTPIYSFTGETGLGIYRLTTGGLGMSVNGINQISVTSNVVSFNKPIEIKESTTSTGSTGVGRLYKQVGSNALIWNVDGVEIDVSSDMKYPAYATDGSHLAPSYSFENDVKTGFYRLHDGVIGVSCDGIDVLNISNDSVHVSNKLSANTMQLVSNNNISDSTLIPVNTGYLYKKPGSNGLYWKTDISNEINLLNTSVGFTGGVVSDPLLLPIGSVTHPSLSFSADATTGLFYRGSGDSKLLNITIDGKLSAVFEVDSINAPNGSKITPGYSFINKPNYGMYVSSETINGVTCDMLKLSTGGVDNIMMSSNMTQINKRLRIKDTNLDSTETSDGYGELYKEAHSSVLYWKVTGEEPVPLTSKIEYPLTADNGSTSAPSYSFESDTKSGMYLNNLGRPSIVKNSTACASFDDGKIYSSSKGTVLNPTYSYEGNEHEGMMLDLTGPSKQVCIVVNSTSKLNISEDTIATGNVLSVSNQGSSSNPSIGVNGINGHSAGLYKISDTTLGVTSGITEALRVDENDIQLSRNLLLKAVNEPQTPPVNNGYLFMKTNPDQNLYWKTADKEVSLTREDGLQLTAGSTIITGDIVGFDTITSSKVVKSVGGFSKVIQSSSVNPATIAASNEASTVARFASNTNESLIISLTTTSDNAGSTHISIVGTWINDLTAEKITSVVFNTGLLVTGNLPECHCSIVEIDSVNKWYVVSGISDESNVIHLRKIRLYNSNGTGMYQLDSSGTYESKTITANGVAYDSTYDSATDTLICAVYVPSEMNFTVLLVQANSGSNLALGLDGTMENNISMEMIANSNKQLHVVSLPGQVAIISYGNNKTSFIAMSYNSPITQGETIIDYDSYDCVDMCFDVNENMLLCLEKTITPSCFIQAIDVLGTKMQRTAYKNFKNQTMEPFGMAYNATTENYTILYGDANNSANMYFKMFTFNGDEFDVSMQYTANGDTYIESNTFRKGRKVFALSDRYMLGTWHNSTLNIVRFEDGFSSYPSAFIGIASTSAVANNPVMIEPRGSIYTTKTPLNVGWLGRKLYLADFNLDFPNNLSTNSNNGKFIGTCLGLNKILIGL